MELKVTGRDIALTRALKDYVEKRLGRVERHIPRIIDVQVVMRRERKDHVVDIRLNAANLHLKISGRSEDMYASIDNAIAKLERASLRQKERRIQSPRLREIRGRNAQLQKVLKTVEPDSELEVELVPKRLSVKPMSVEEAVLQLKTLDYMFLVFRDSDDSQMKVLYRRNDHAFGLLEPGEV